MKAKVFDLFLKLVIAPSWRQRHLAHVQGKVLEAGGGSGLSLPCYPCTGFTELNIVDLDASMLTLAVQRKLPGQQMVMVCQGNVEALPFESGTFDTVVAQFLFCGVRQPVEGLRECRRVLAPGGKRVEPLLREAGWRVVRREDLFLDVIRLFEAVPQEALR